MLFRKKKKQKSAPAEKALELLPQLLTKSDTTEQKLLRYLLTHVNGKTLKTAALVIAGGGAALSLAGSIARKHMIRRTMARELKKQLAPVNRKLDEREKQNEELKKQNEQLKKQLR